MSRKIPSNSSESDYYGEHPQYSVQYCSTVLCSRNGSGFQLNHAKWSKVTNLKAKRNAYPPP